MWKVTPGTTSYRGFRVRVLDASTGAPYTSATSATAGASFGYTRPGSTRTSISLSDLAAVDSAFSSGGIKHIGSGWYRLDVPDAAIAAGVDGVLIDGAFTSYVVVCPPILLETTQTGDSFARIGAAGAGLTAVGDTAGTTTLLTRITALIQTKTEADTAHGLLATAAKMLSYFQSALRSDVTVDTDIGGTYDDATDSQQAIRDRGDAAWSPPTVGAIADQVWDEALAGHLTAGTTGKALSDAGAAGDPWSTDLDAGGYAAGSAGDILLDLQGGTVYATGSTPNTDADLYIRRGDTVAVTIGDLTGLAAGWDVLWVTIKRSEHDADSAAILQVRLNVATPTLPGLIYINGQTPTDAGVAATDAWISDVDAGADTLVLNIKPAASLLLPARGSLWWDVQMADGTAITSLTTGEKTAEIGADITRATS